MKVTKYSALLALLMTSGLVHAQTEVNQEITAPTWNAANSTDTYAETVASLNATGLTPAEIAANAVNDAFAAAVTTLNEDDTTPGSAAFYRAARIALDADPTDIVLQAELARAQTLYSTNLTTVTNLEAAAEVEGVSINTFSGASGQDVIGIDLDDSEGAAAVALAAAQEASNAIEGILDYYGEGAGATTTEESFADLEGEVIDPLRDLVASNPALDVNNDGFLDADALAVTTAAGNLATAEADYQTVASDPTSTQAQIATAAGALAGAQTAFATSVVTLYENFSPITAPTKDALLGSVLNGSWERDAIKSSAEGLAQEVEDRAALIRTEGDNADGNPIIHIGENSLVTQELGGEQLLSATDGVDDIDIRISGDTNLIVDNDLTVTGETTTNGINNSGEQINGVADGVADDDAATVGQVNAADDVVRSEFAAADTVERNARTAADTAIRGEFAAADTALGTAVRSEFAAADTVERNARTAADTAIRGEFAAADTALGTAVRSEFAAADTVERNARTAADTAIRGEFAAADTALGGAVRSEFAAADTVERNARTAADTAIRGEFAAADTALGSAVRSEFAAADTTERNARTAADTAIRGEFATADTALGGRIDSEISARIAGDTAVRTEFAAADTVIRTQFAAADTAIRNEFAAADTTERNARIAGDDRLQSNIDENTRGIAMVAAMTNTTVDIGKTHGVDFNMAQFQSETGFAFGYANRINENVQVHTSVASTTDFDESVVRLGVAVQW
jgi:hypothetical protein